MRYAEIALRPGHPLSTHEPRAVGGGRAAGLARMHGRLAQRESASFTPRRSLVRSQYRPPGGLDPKGQQLATGNAPQIGADCGEPRSSIQDQRDCSAAHSSSVSTGTQELASAG
jgi:hypothetical protein